MHATRSSSTVGSSNGRSSRRGGRGKQGRRRAWLERKRQTDAARVVGFLGRRLVVGHTIKGTSMPGVRWRNICTGSELSKRLSKRGLATPWWVDEGESDRSTQSVNNSSSNIRETSVESKAGSSGTRLVWLPGVV